MKHRLYVVLVALGLFAISAVPALAQYTQIKGSIKGTDGKPIPDVKVDFKNTATGQQIHLKSDKKGEFFSIGVSPGTYNVEFTDKSGQKIWALTNFPITLQQEVNLVDVDLQKEKAAAAASGAQPPMTEEQKKEVEKVNKENATIKDLNALLQQGRALEATDPNQAIPVYAKATQIDPTRPLLWAALGNADINAARKDTDPASKKQKFSDGADSLKKAIDLATASTDPKAKASLGGYYNNYAEALGHSGKSEDAAAAYAKAAEIDPPNAAMYYRNEGITYENAGKIDDAVAAYDKSIAADPTAADSYFRKGISLLGKATTKGDKMDAPPGTAEAFNKYLELAPDGPNAETAKQMLAAIGAKVETSYGKGKKK
jgi:tetratricopeptide (TPR) repeat protein